MNELTLTIKLTSAGAINVSGPIDNKILAYGLLEAAREAIADHHAKLSKSAIVPATMVPKFQNPV